MRLPLELTPLRFLGAIARARLGLTVSACVLGVLALLPGAVLPLAIGDAVEAVGRGASLAGPIGLIVALGIAQAVFVAASMFTTHGMWIHGAATTQRTVARHTARLGASLRAQAATGDVMAISSSDIARIGNGLESVGRVVGAAIGFLVVGVALVTISPMLGAIALVGIPLAVLSIGKLVKPFQRRKAAQREQLTEVNALAADIVSGLRILRGIGGERRYSSRFRQASQRVRLAGNEVARTESWLAGAEVLMPGLVTVAITWLGARLAISGTITVGELVSFYAASAFLAWPVATATESMHAFVSALVSAKKVCHVLELRPLLDEPDSPVALPEGPLELFDPATGLTVVAGKLTVINAGPRAEALAERLAHFPRTDSASEHQVLVSGVPTDRVALAELRSRVVYAHNQDLWFSGTLRDQFVPPERAEAALWAADAADIIDGLPDGLDELIGERGREVSGGQRQRLSLARALALDADTLLLDEPTSAVDTHTEARITERIAALRRGKTTVVFSESPLWTSVADEVITC
ncbi:ABC transporter transmembrane domain-containing protein [Amycolatopsis taiwanensis]|uniref:Multidrug ABC transporter permease n=1 Tax=Amycolatopsis taiwanensis TaxID=342230 RepID=A0A9W6R0K7_9PSEU|nr:ABC transporter ATP-binding protein [Amycolatopsis taiwanensis]GLY67384.1 multidrug ABC transporter permease [Amycolatopsis taiwanensis]